MFKCVWCNKVFNGNYNNCPICGKRGNSWEPVEEKEPSPPVSETIKKIIEWLAHMND